MQVHRPQKSVLRAYMYLFLLGYVGAHCFYLKKPGMGLVSIMLFLIGAGLVATGFFTDRDDYIYGGFAAWAIVLTMMVADLVMIPGQIEELNDTGEDRRFAAMTGNLDPSFQATMRHAGLDDKADAPRKSALPDDMKRPWKQEKTEAATYKPGDD